MAPSSPFHRLPLLPHMLALLAQCQRLLKHVVHGMCTKESSHCCGKELQRQCIWLQRVKVLVQLQVNGVTASRLQWPQQ